MNGTIPSAGGVTWSKIASGLFALLVALVVYTWMDHIGDFEKFQETTEVNFKEVKDLIRSK